MDIFEEWVRQDVGKVFVQLFDVTLEAFFGGHLLCIHVLLAAMVPHWSTTATSSCDHFVEPDFLLGNIHETHMIELVSSTRQRRFGDNKRYLLMAQCRECDVRGLCHGGCPKDRLHPRGGRRGGP